MATETSSDPKLELVKGYLQNGWLRTKSESPELRAYFDFQDELSTLAGVLSRDLYY